MSSRLVFWTVVYFLFLFSVFSIGSALQESLTYDEVVYLEEGRAAWIHRTFDVDTYNPPLIRNLAALPFVLGADRLILSPYPNMRALPARLVIVTLSVFLLYAVFLVGKHFYGPEAGVFSLVLLAFQPMALAHSHYVTLDMGATFFFFLAYMQLVTMLKVPALKNAIFLGIFAGLMAASKLTVLVYFAVSAFFLVLAEKNRKVFALWLAPVIAVALITIWSTYLFKTNVVMAPGGYAESKVTSLVSLYARISNNKKLSEFFRFPQNIQMPLGDYIRVVKKVFARSEDNVPVFFMGSEHQGSRWYFMPTNWFFKTPLPMLILFIAALYFGWSKREMRKRLVLFGIPVLAIFFSSAWSRLRPDVRYVLPVYPFMAILAGSMIAHAENKWWKPGILILGLWLLFGSLFFYPHFLSYFNEFSGSRKQIVANFDDSNIDWGQSLISFKKFIDQEKPSGVRFSYFGRDDAAAYGLPSDFAFGGYKFNEICAFHDISYPENEGRVITAISISNWHQCGYGLDPKYAIERVKGIVGDSILIYEKN